MKTTNIKNETRDGSAILTIAIILSIGFICVIMAGTSYGAASGAVHVADMQASLVAGSTGKSAQVIVSIADQLGNPVQGATVAGAWSGLFKSSVSGVTGASGKITFISRSTSKIGTITFKVAGVSAAGYSYDASLNAISQISISTSESANQKPVANIATLPATVGLAPLAVDFDGSGSYDPDGSIASYQWDFGDGSTAATAAAAHTFTIAGIFTVTLTVADDKGATGTTVTTVTVTSDETKTMYVSGISLSTASNKSGDRVNATVTVRCLEDGTAVSNATVSVQWSELFNYAASGNTGDLGTVYFNSASTRKSGYAIFTVTGITAPGYVYDPRYNNGTDASIYVY